MYFKMSELENWSKRLDEMLEENEHLRKHLKRLKQEVDESLYGCKHQNRPGLQLKDLGFGDVIKFGQYPFYDDGEDKAIEWQVLEKNDNQIFVVSRYGIDFKRYNDQNVNVTWETCSLRKWLNHEFLNTAFSDEEKNKIAISKVEPDLSSTWKSDAGNDTFDHVFILSAKEAHRYFGKDILTPLRVTPYVKYYKDTAQWWLRTSGYENNYAACVFADGSEFEYGWPVNSDDFAVRPAMWIKIDD